MACGNTGRLKVTAAQLESAKGRLDGQNRQLKNQISQLRTIERQLNQMWDGDANDAFHQVFEKDSRQFDAFSDLISKYSNVLQQAVETYRDTERKNVELAKNR